MKITCNVYNKIILSQRDTPPETGGILGGINGTVTAAELDKGMQTREGCCYSPNVKAINETIKSWQQDNILFMGIFHTHFFGVKTLSLADKSYIEKIMKNMPSFIEGLYFPLIVMPQKEMIVYKATTNKERLTFEAENIVII